jgi:hypothetical protein
MMRKENLPQPRGRTTAQNDASEMSSSQNSRNNEQDNAYDSTQLEQENNATATTTDHSNALIPSLLISQIHSRTNNCAEDYISLEMRRQHEEQRRISLDSFLTEAIRISEEALAEMRYRSNMQATTSNAQQSSNSSGNGNVGSNTKES